MSALTSLLVRDRVVPVSKIEQALHAQVFQGGDIEVILLVIRGPVDLERASSCR